MKEEINCNIIKDLLPSYIDGILSEESEKCVDNHLKNCNACREVYENMTAEMEIDKVPEVGNVKKFLNKTKTMFFLYGLLGLSFVAILVCLIVDICVSGRFTWSLISTSGIVFGDAVLYTLLTSKKNKVVKTLAVASVGVPVLVSIIQIVLYYLMGKGNMWIFNIGLPIIAIWIATVWIVVLIRHVFNVKLLYCLSIFSFIGIVANYITMIITGDITSDNIFTIMVFLKTGLGNLAGAVIFAILGSILKVDKKLNR